MRAVVQRVSGASVRVDEQDVGRIERGYLVLVGVAHGDTADDAEYLAQKIVDLRVFEDSAGKMNQALVEVAGSVLAISQFTLLADCRKGRRPSFSHAATPEVAQPLFERFVEAVRQRGIPVETGQFGAHMDVELVNDGPVTLLLDSQKTL